jgi:hypothetical protein
MAIRSRELIETTWSTSNDPGFLLKNIYYCKLGQEKICAKLLLLHQSGTRLAAVLFDPHMPSKCLASPVRKQIGPSRASNLDEQKSWMKIFSLINFGIGDPGLHVCEFRRGHPA